MIPFTPPCFSLSSEYLEVFNNVDVNITSLDISDNSLDDKDAAIMCNGIYKLKGLQTLSLAGNNFSNRGYNSR